MEAEGDLLPKNSPDRIIFMSMCNEFELYKSWQRADVLPEDFMPGLWYHVGDGYEESWNNDTFEDTCGRWDATAEKWTTSSLC